METHFLQIFVCTFHTNTDMFSRHLVCTLFNYVDTFYCSFLQHSAQKTNLSCRLADEVAFFSPKETTVYV